MEFCLSIFGIKWVYSQTLIIPTLIIWTCFPGPIFFMNINKMWSWKIETIKSSLILPKVPLKHCFNLFCFERAWAAWEEHSFWCIQLNCDWLNNFVMLLRKCHAWFHVGYVNTRPIYCKLKSQQCLPNETSLFVQLG